MNKMCHPIAVTLFDSSVEPMTKFEDHNEHLLESALGNPSRVFDGKELYPTLVKKAAILYYGLIKNHPFKNGNKRTATASLLVFLYINNCWIKGIHKDIEDYLVSMATKVASSKGNQNKEQLLAEIENWLDEHMATHEK